MSAILPRSLYADTAVPGPGTPPLTGDARADVIVVGAGFTGLPAALHLAEQGVDVRVLEANEFGWGASGRNGGQVNPGLKFDPDQIEADFSAEVGRRMLTFSDAAPQRVFDLDERHQIVCEARRDGTIRAAKSERNALVVRHSAAKWAAHGAPVQLLDRAAIAAATGTGRYVCGTADPRGGDRSAAGCAGGAGDAEPVGCSATALMAGPRQQDGRSLRGATMA